jgi:ComF family protein
MLSNAGATKFDSARRETTMSLTHRLVGGLRAALPQACVLCGGASGAALLCAACMDDMPRIASPCPTCALETPAGSVCGTCLARPPPQAATIAAWCYAFPVDRLLHAFKYGGRLALADPFADALVDAVTRRESSVPDAVLALPLAVGRQRARGFNQAQEIARGVALRLAVPRMAGLRRVRDSPPQAGLALAARARNVRHAFEAVSDFHGIAVAIVDDVMTTGATLAEAASALLGAGARRVEAWVVARTPPPSRRTPQNSLHRA